MMDQKLLTPQPSQSSKVKKFRRQRLRHLTTLTFFPVLNFRNRLPNYPNNHQLTNQDNGPYHLHQDSLKATISLFLHVNNSSHFSSTLRNKTRLPLRTFLRTLTTAFFQILIHLPREMQPTLHQASGHRRPLTENNHRLLENMTAREHAETRLPGQSFQHRPHRNAQDYRAHLL